jgi:hypothetical protein
MKTEPSAWGYNWATLFLRHIHTGSWPLRLGESRIWDSKIWQRVPRDTDLKMTALARTSSNCIRQTRPLVREGAVHQQTHNSQTVTKIWSWAPDGCLTPRQTGRLTVGRNITWTFWVELVEELQLWEVRRSETIREPRRRGTSAVGRRYQTTASENWED